MAQRQSGTTDEKPTKIMAADVYEGDRVLMGINWHGKAHDGFYHRALYQSVVEGTVTDAPKEDTAVREMVANGEHPMADYAIETDDGEVYRWNVDNGYIIGYHHGLERRSDIGRFGGFYEA